ncbi:LysM peptidoglycan-binding domain-containing protein [Thiorhodovibrio frisius]|uniref:LysM domain-containing protein n=1 Tax=Thiorhodovibrio frisius TaxID=631362 RepID=H8Z2C1_9GAMM|nr:LysM peptidoglycan-binding domain-containing protein [Thiorhodovibrio frisius]EIC21576.1 LysM domain-containing protein [Thiorhodovibrio frisius]WPL21542.1 putative peptidoglycan endopeptidase LytE precursor [Thiorhodovibrio frisius]
MNTKKLALSAVLIFGTAHAATDSVVAYTLTEGEDIQTVAGNYDLTVEQILVTNGMETDEITVGTVIYIPPLHATGYFNPETGVYTVAAGDDLYEIARRFGTTVAALEAVNELSGDTIAAGQTLQIPD